MAKKKLYKHTCDRCRAVTMEMNGTAIEDSFEAAMNPFRVFVTPEKYELWCDDCIEYHARFCSTHISDYNAPTHYYSSAYVKALGGICPFCELSLTFDKPVARIPPKENSDTLQSPKKKKSVTRQTKKKRLYTGSGLTQTRVSTKDRNSALPRKRTL